MLSHPELDKDDCYCHKRGCRRDVGKGEPIQPSSLVRISIGALPRTSLVACGVAVAERALIHVHYLAHM